MPNVIFVQYQQIKSIQQASLGAYTVVVGDGNLPYDIQKEMFCNC